MTLPNAGASSSFAAMMEDPFVSQSGNSGNSGQPAATRESHRYSSFDTQLFSLNASSPAQAKRALEAHLAETERRLEEASKLGTALIDQQRELTEQLKEVELQQDEGEMGPELRQRLADLEREYTEIGRESARAFLAPKRLAGGSEDPQLGTPGFDQKSPLSPALFASQATNSPSKVSVPSRKQRNQPSSRVHDIEFATEISTSLLAQVRQLQALLAEREETLKSVNLEKSRLEIEAEGYSQRIRTLDDSEQRYKDENWALETQIHELMAAVKDATERESRLNSSLSTSNSEKNAVERELEELRQANAKLLEDQTIAQKANDSEIHLLRRNLTAGDAEKLALQKKLEELTGQNQELAKAVAMRIRQFESQAARDLPDDNDGEEPEQTTPDNSPPPSPNKFTPRHNHLESETLKSSLGHAHRMIQNLKSTIHREKTEKIELKRMLQDTRDELEQRRRETIPPNGSTKRLKTKENSFRKPARPDLLGAGRKEKSMVELEIHDTDWEDNAGQGSPTRSIMASSARSRSGAIPPDEPSDSYQSATETEDGFETANERAAATESEAFQTGVESMADDSSDDSADLTETETNFQTTPRNRVSSIMMAKARDRTSYHSTASATSDEDDTDGGFPSPSQSHISGRRVRSKRSVLRRIRPSGEAPMASSSRPSSARESPAPSFEEQPVAQEGQSLFAELAELEGGDEEDEGVTTSSQASTPRMGPSLGSRRPSEVMLDSLPKPVMVDSGVMTDPWDSSTPVAAATGAAVSAVSDTPTTPQRGVGREIATESEETPKWVSSGTQWTPLKPVAGDGDHLANVPTPPKMAWDERAIETRLVEAGTQAEPAQMGIAAVSSQETLPTVPKWPEPAIAYLPGGVTDPVKHELPAPEIPVMSFSSITSESTEPVKAVIPEPEALAPVESVREPPELSLSSLYTYSTEPILAQLPEPIAAFEEVVIPELAVSTIFSQHTEPVQAKPAPAPEPIMLPAPVPEPVLPDLSITMLNPAFTEPVKAEPAPAPEPVLPDLSITMLNPASTEPVKAEPAPAPEPVLPDLSITMLNPAFTEPVRAEPAPAPEPIMIPAPVPELVLPELSISLLDPAFTEPVKAEPAPAPEPIMIPAPVPEPVLPDLSITMLNPAFTEPVKAEPAPAPEPIMIPAPVPELVLPELSISLLDPAFTEPVKAEPAPAPEPIMIPAPVPEPVLPDLSITMLNPAFTEPVKAEPAPAPEPIMIPAPVPELVLPELSISLLDPAFTEPANPRRVEVLPLPTPTISTLQSVETPPVGSVARVIPFMSDFAIQTDPIEVSKATAAAVVIHDGKQDESSDPTHGRSSTTTSERRTSTGLALSDFSGNALPLDSGRQQPSFVSSDQGSQTILSSKQIDQILMDRESRSISSSDSKQTMEMAAAGAAAGVAGASAFATPKLRPRLQAQSSAKSGASSQIRPDTATSQTSTLSIYPPLPAGHREAIAAAEKRSVDMPPTPSPGVMGPPLAPASAYRMNVQAAPRTPNDQSTGAGSARTVSTHAGVRRGSQSQMSRRSSVSSFASELEERFNMNPYSGPMPQGYGPGTDPRMIQAITQTMIGEFLWKYTRKTGSSEMSSTRHRRYFWVHPYTRTLYWSEQDPQTAGKSQLRTKSVPIEAVRVVADDNPYPPGLHCRSLEVVSPGRRVRFTATTSQRHETWFNALSYLLLRETNDNCEDHENSVTLDDIDEFNPGFRSASRQAARMSLSSYNSRTLRQPPKQQRAASAMSMRSTGGTTGRASPALSSPGPNSSLQVPEDPPQRSSSRFSTILNSSIRGSIASLKGRHGQAASVHSESIRDQTSVENLAQEAEDEDRLENVRACCDGKHDVGSLSRNSRYSPRVDRSHSHH
ncbi:Anucleate primary sterigmata protein A [Penicillium canariense]|uniref:Anucleate primary sterigmata protein A n=1 Tax=Penicillium canariense TaxID=189055 RepID=A0A9W9IH71_9EURO|nr:Anucleate primary sterigmata protein A [Penicillium canariense]KAJ5177120.1 Anucleate primary sterigmata protein A [Penicillium canariense]